MQQRRPEAKAKHGSIAANAHRPILLFNYVITICELFLCATSKNCDIPLGGHYFGKNSWAKTNSVCKN